jgi:uncharacterized membrane protein
MKPKSSWWLLIIVSLGVMIPFVAPYFTFDPAKSRVAVTTADFQYPLLLAHIIFACVALVSGFVQFNDGIRIHRPKVHRYLGRIYVCSVFASGFLALAVVLYIENFTKATAFLALSLIWIYTTWKGYRTAKRKNMNEHRKWRIRSFSITLVAVSARLLVPVLLLTYYALNGFSLPGGREKMVEEALNVNIWTGLVLNFMIVEWKFLKSSKK